MAVHPNSLKAIEPSKRKKGQPALNRTGRNGWTVLREKYRDRLEPDVADLQDVLIEVAKTGDVQALRLALGSILNTRAIELTGTHGAPINFGALARKAHQNDEPGDDEHRNPGRPRSKSSVKSQIRPPRRETAPRRHSILLTSV